MEAAPNVVSQPGPSEASSDCHQPGPSTSPLPDNEVNPASFSLSSPEVPQLDNNAQRNRGRPRTKPIIYGPKRPRGRPKGSSSTNSKQKRTRSSHVASVSRSTQASNYCKVNLVIRDGPIVGPGTLRPGDIVRPLVAPAAQAQAQTQILEEEAQSASLPASPPVTTHSVIQGEDPECSVVDLAAADEETNADGQGIGAEEDDVDELDNDGDVRDSGEKLRRRRPLPPWLLDAFNSRVEDSKPRNAQGLPSLYAIHGSFWFPQKSSVFILNKSNVSPPDLFNPKFFLWDPQALQKTIPCPQCKAPLQRHQHINWPRRCVDFNSTFWIIGYRYCCPKCVNPRTQRRPATYRSWDPQILACLAPHLASEFPAYLSHRSAMSKELFEWMRTCFQNGIGSKQFSDSLRVQHLLAYDKLHLQYLHHIADLRKGLDSWAGIKYEAVLPFEDRSSRGRHGFVPGSEWLRDMYDDFIEAHQHDFNQHMSMLTGEVCAIDHSHKVTKQIARVNGEQIFTALLTVTNEKGEIRICNFVATKSHSQFEIALTRMQNSLEQYGHKQPILFYTDNMADKQFLENSFPSLRSGVTPIEKYAYLEPLNITSSVVVFDSTESINNAISTILDDVPIDHGEIIVGFDSEWNVELSPQGFVRNVGNTAVIQIAYKKRVLILQIATMASRGVLPNKLQLFLSHPRIRKAGRLVNSDLTKLQNVSRSSQPFVGGLDLAKLAKERFLIKSTTNCSLSDLCALVLQRRLNKNTPERVSQAWENHNLTPEQVSYAAMDAYTALEIYTKLVNDYKVPSLLPPDPPPLSPILLLGSDLSSVIAEGRISLNPPENKLVDGVPITKKHIVIDVLHVHNRGAIISSHKKQSLDSFGNPPFSLVCLRNHLRLYSPAISNHHETACTSSTSTPITSTCIPSCDEVPDDQFDVQNETISLGESLSADISGTSTDVTDNYAVDTQSASVGAEVIEEVPSEWDYSVHSRVLKDVWHVFHMLYLPATHALRKQFTRELRDAFFIPNNEDQRQINSWGAMQKPPKMYQELRNSMPDWTRARCRHTIPPPHLLYPLVAKVFRTYGPLIDPTTKQPLFSASAWKTASNILELVRKGFVSDPPGIALYTRIGTDRKTGLPIYRCARGTNATEGGVHTHIRTCLPKFGVSVRHVHASLLDFTLRHNLLTGVYNSTGQHYKSHFSIWVTNDIQELLITLQDMFNQPIIMNGWVNGNLYVPTNEVIGILPIPSDVRELSAMASYVHATGGKQKYSFIASMQGTRKPVLPVHTSAEEQFYHQLMENDPSFSPRSGEPHWNEAVKVWNSNADVKDGIYYKLIEQLKSYYTKWKTRLHVKETLSLTAEQRRSVTHLIHDQHRSCIAPTVAAKPLQLHRVTTGFSNMSNMAESSNSIRVFETSTGQPHAGPSMESMDYRQQTELAARQRVTNQLQKRKVVNKPRKHRTCRKCAIFECPGKRRVSDCKNPCRDCGKVECPGRNSHKLHLTCWEVAGEQC